MVVMVTGMVVLVVIGLHLVSSGSRGCRDLRSCMVVMVMQSRQSHAIHEEGLICHGVHGVVIDL